MTKRAVIYARVSYDDRKHESRNLEGQIEDGRAYCAQKGYQIVAELAEDDRGASGADWDLPRLNQALDMAREGEADVLVIRELDRFARGLAKQLVVEGEFKRYRVDTEYVLGEYPDTPEGTLMKNVRAVVAEYERLKIEERMTRAKRNIVKKGKLMLHGDRPPYGYRLEDGMLVVYEPEARVVRLIFTWYVYGDENGKRLGIMAVAKKLTGMRVPTWSDVHGGFGKKRGQGEWNPGTIAWLLSNETYTGVWHYGKRNDRRKKANPRDYWLPVEVPAIIPRELWEAAQERRKFNQEMSRRNVRNEYLMGRRVTCGKCGSKMVGRPIPSSRGDKMYLYYYCPAKVGIIVTRCDTKYFRADQVDGAVWGWVKDLLLNPEALRQSLEAVQAGQELANKPLWDRLAVIDDLLTTHRGQLERLLDLYLSGDFDKTMLIDRKARLETTITALEKERAGLLTTLEAQTMTDDQIMTIEDLAKRVAEELAGAEGDFEARRHIIDLLDVRVVLAIEDGQKVAYVHCLVDEAELSVDSSTSRTLRNTARRS